MDPNGWLVVRHVASCHSPGVSPVSAITALAAVNLPQPACHSRVLTFSHLTLGHDSVTESVLVENFQSFKVFTSTLYFFLSRLYFLLLTFYFLLQTFISY
jgi:hypothetical protein